MADNTQRVTDAAHEPSKQAPRLLLFLTALGGAIVAAPLLAQGKDQPWFAVLALVLLLPYMVVGWRLLRTPLAKEGPGLALGIGLMFVPPGLLLVATVLSGHPDYPRAAYFAALVIVHLLLIAVAVPAFRRGTSRKPTAQVLVRSIVEPAVYFGIVMLLVAGAHLR